MANPASFIWYELMTTDADAAAKFYGSVIGWNFAGRVATTAPGARDYRSIGRSDGGMAGGVLQLTPDMCAGGARPAWVGYLHVKDVDAAAKAIERDGGSVLMPKLSLPVGDMAMVTDPMGAPFYVMKPIPPAHLPNAVSDVFHPEASQRVRWNELTTPDIERAKAFYTSHFGFAIKDSMSMGPMGDYWFIDENKQRVGGMMQKQPQNPSSGWLFYIGVDSVMAAHRASVAGGGRVMYEPHEVPGGGWVAVAADPQGAVFGITGPKGE